MKTIKQIFTYLIMFIFGTIIFSPLIILILIYGFNFNLPRDGQWVPLSTIKESKEMNVFISEYITPKNGLELGNGEELKFIKAWLDNSWTYNLFSRADIDEGTYELHLIQDSLNANQISEEYYLFWKTGYLRIESAENYSENGDLQNCILTARANEIGDTLNIFVAKRRKMEINEDSKSSISTNRKRTVYDTLTSFNLIRKYE